MVAYGHRAAGDLDQHRLVVRPGLFDDALDQGEPLFARVRNVQADAVEAAPQATQMFGGAKRTARVDGDDLVNTVAEQKPPVHDRDHGLVPRQELAVQIDDAHLNQSIRVSHARPKMPATGTFSKATTGYSPRTLPSTSSLSVAIT